MDMIIFSNECFMLFLQALSTTVLRTQTTAQLEALASITKAPSTSSLIAAANAAKKGNTTKNLTLYGIFVSLL